MKSIKVIPQLINHSPNQGNISLYNNLLPQPQQTPQPNN
jgi:hypothetical protein